jgi:hypothetical protein
MSENGDHDRDEQHGGAWGGSEYMGGGVFKDWKNDTGIMGMARKISGVVLLISTFILICIIFDIAVNETMPISVTTLASVSMAAMATYLIADFNADI